MPIHSFDQIMRDLKNKVYYPVYLLQGDEPYYIDLISDYIEGHVLTGNESEFNQTVLYGRDTDLLSGKCGKALSDDGKLPGYYCKGSAGY